MNGTTDHCTSCKPQVLRTQSLRFVFKSIFFLTPDPTHHVPCSSSSDSLSSPSFHLHSHLPRLGYHHLSPEMSWESNWPSWIPYCLLPVCFHTAAGLRNPSVVPHFSWDKDQFLSVALSPWVAWSPLTSPISYYAHRTTSRGVLWNSSLGFASASGFLLMPFSLMD